MTHRKPTTRRTHHAKDNNNLIGCLTPNFKRSTITAHLPHVPIPRHPYNLRQTVQRTARIERDAAAAAARLEKEQVALCDIMRVNTNLRDSRARPRWMEDPRQSSPATPASALRSWGYVTRMELLLGSGHFSKVYRATNIPKPKPDGTMSPVESFAVKVISLNQVGTDYRERFLPRELACWPKLLHSNICRLKEILEFNDMYVFMVMEYCPLGDLLTYVQKNGALNDLTGKKWMSEVLEAVNYMHSKKIAHRDIKAENCLITARKTVKLGDFGFAVEVTTDAFSRTYCGSRTYSSPEILSGVPYDVFKADVWSLGCLVYVALTGTMPFREDGQTSGGIVEQQRRRCLRYPNFVGDDVIYAIDSLLVFSQESRPSAYMAREIPFFAAGALLSKREEEQHQAQAQIEVLSAPIFRKIPMACK